jgi:hypothetical protein
VEGMWEGRVVIESWVWSVVVVGSFGSILRQMIALIYAK